LPNYYAAMGGHNGEYRVKSFLGNFGSKVFLANSCVETNRYASDLFGEADFTDSSISVSVASDSFSHSQSVSVKLLKLVRPEEFVSLKTGGPLNNHKCEGYWHRQGDPLFNNRNYKKITFNQQ
jgi:type IV secretory pathway TraG/TraD family ATPase VirD4